MNNPSIVFDKLEIRAKSEQSNPALDRISIRDYIKEVEIGAFQVERDLTQRVKFNVVVEVSDSSSSSSDDVDDILSYDMIIEAIDEQLNFERLNLLETIPTHQITRRKNLGCQVFENKDEKLRVIVEDVKKLASNGHAILVGLKSVLTSQEVARAFDKYAADLPIEILNAVNNAEENSIVARAGQCGAVTVATNMAGRGTDIKISQSVRNTGGLHVIIAETNDFSRIDRQLIGRCARQGDPGTCIRYVALNEDVIVRFLPKFLT